MLGGARSGGEIDDPYILAEENSWLGEEKRDLRSEKFLTARARVPENARYCQEILTADFGCVVAWVGGPIFVLGSFSRCGLDDVFSVLNLGYKPMTNRQYEESYPQGKLWCYQGRHMRPIDHFELGGEKPLGHRPGRVDWWRAFAVSAPVGMHDEPHFGPRDTLESAARKWAEAVEEGELDVAPTAEELRLAIARGRVVVNNKHTGAYVVALPWEQSAFCKDCRTALEVRDRVAAYGRGACSSAELEELIRARRKAQYHGLCWLCRQGTARQLVHVYDVEPGIDNHSPHDGWVLVCDDCDRTLFAYHGTPEAYLADHVTDYPGVDHTVLRLDDPPLQNELFVRRFYA